MSKDHINIVPGSVEKIELYEGDPSLTVEDYGFDNDNILDMELEELNSFPLTDPETLPSADLSNIDTDSEVFKAEAENKVNWVRQRDWFNPLEHPKSHVTMIGAGGIGSPTALALSKLGIAEIELIDFDEVEAHNIPNQMYTVHHAGITKTEALGALCEAFGATKVITHDARGEEVDSAYHGVVVTGLDNMDARKVMWEKVKEHAENIELFVDARLGGQTVVVYAFDPKDETAREYYEMFGLFPQSEAVEAPCTAQAVIDVSFTVASLITRQIRRHYGGEKPEMVIQFDQETLTIEK